MTTETVAGLLLIVVSLAFNAAFALLAARFDILREPTADVLARFRAGGTPLVLLSWAFALLAYPAVAAMVGLRSAGSHGQHGRTTSGAMSRSRARRRCPPGLDARTWRTWPPRSATGRSRSSCSGRTRRGASRCARIRGSIRAR